MSDEADIANDRAELDLTRAISAARGEIKPGVEGNCDLCGEHSMRPLQRQVPPRMSAPIMHIYNPVPHVGSGVAARKAGCIVCNSPATTSIPVHGSSPHFPPAGNPHRDVSLGCGFSN